MKKKNSEKPKKQQQNSKANTNDLRRYEMVSGKL